MLIYVVGQSEIGIQHYLCTFDNESAKNFRRCRKSYWRRAGKAICLTSIYCLFVSRSLFNQSIVIGASEIELQLHPTRSAKIESVASMSICQIR